MRIMKGVLIMGLLGFLSGCGGPSLKHYDSSAPVVSIQDYFQGPIKAWGIVQDRKGHVVRRFDIDMNGTWDGDEGVLKEQFSYYDGERQERIWKIKKTGDNSYQGRAGDILDVATGETNGNAVRWAYKMDLDVGNNTFRITFDDWMFLMNDGILINRSYLKKFGFTVAELTLFMQKQ